MYVGFDLTVTSALENAMVHIETTVTENGKATVCKSAEIPIGTIGE